MQKRILEDLIDSVSETHPQEQLGRQEFLMTYSKTNDKTIKKLEGDVKVLAAQQQEKIAEVLKIKQFNEGLEKTIQWYKEHKSLWERQLPLRHVPVKAKDGSIMWY